LVGIPTKIDGERTHWPLTVTARFIDRWVKDVSLETFLLNLFYSGKLQAMPASYRTDDGRFEGIRPLIEGAAADIVAFAEALAGRAQARRNDPRQPQRPPRSRDQCCTKIPGASSIKCVERRGRFSCTRSRLVALFAMIEFIGMDLWSGVSGYLTPHCKFSPGLHLQP
jgi:hypothetical protein